ncbi:hypothetical protein D047_3048A, partial [Vibrio parahaemolyticus VPTS-2010_2]
MRCRCHFSHSGRHH